MLKEQRISIILDELALSGVIAIEDLAKKMNVSHSRFAEILRSWRVRPFCGAFAEARPHARRSLPLSRPSR